LINKEAILVGLLIFLAGQRPVYPVKHSMFNSNSRGRVMIEVWGCEGKGAGVFRMNPGY